MCVGVPSKHHTHKINPTYFNFTHYKRPVHQVSAQYGKKLKFMVECTKAYLGDYSILYMRGKMSVQELGGQRREVA